MFSEDLNLEVNNMISVRNMLYLMTIPVVTALACWAIWLLVV